MLPAEVYLSMASQTKMTIDDLSGMPGCSMFWLCNMENSFILTVEQTMQGEQKL